MRFIEELAKKTNNDGYFKAIYKKIQIKYFEKVLKSEDDVEITEKEYYDLLRYADILCRADEGEYRQKAYKIISLLNEFYRDRQDYRVYAEEILIKLGNFPAKKLISGDEKVYITPERKIEKSIKETYQETPDNKYVFTDNQYKLFEELKNRNYYSFSGPTSFGKSFIIEEYIDYIIQKKQRKNIVILTPTRALITQTREQLKNNKKIIDNYYILEYPEIPYVYKREKRNYIFIFTPERLTAYFGKEEMPKIDYIFVDEAQKIISNDTRAALYYHAILQAEKRKINLYFASPNIPNSEVFLKIFEKKYDNEYMTINESPVNQNKIYIDLFEQKYLAITDDNETININSKLKKIMKETKEEQQVSLLIKKIGAGNQNIIYCNSRSDAVKYAIRLAKNLEEKKNKKIDELVKFIKENIYDEYFLIDCIKKGVAYHFGRLPQIIREKVEELFKEGIIDYIFCTSTLLEGVNLPAKNIFILNNSIATTKLSEIDFGNLAGRAGRLKHDLIGNVICVRCQHKRNSWSGIDKDIELIKNKKYKNVSYELIDGRKKFYENLGNAVQGKDFTNKNATEVQKRIWKNYSNIVLIHSDDNDSPLLIKNFKEKNKNAEQIIEEAQKENDVPKYILEQFPAINPIYQNRILNKEKNYKFPKEITKTTCKEVLECLYEEYNWKEEESKGRGALVENSNRIKYLKHLMYDWMTNKPLKYIISIVIRKYDQDKSWKINGIRQKFNKENREQVNSVINEIMGGIDTDLRFKIKNYMTNYYLLMCEKYGKENAGEDWSQYIEFGTTDLKNIELQKVGIPLHIAKFLIESNNTGITFEGDCLIDINKEKILEQIDKEKNEDAFNEINKRL